MPAPLIEREIETLRAIDDDARYMRFVHDWLNHGFPDGAEVYCSPDLAPRTNAVLKRLASQARRQRDQARRGTPRRRNIESYLQRLKKAQGAAAKTIQDQQTRSRGVRRRYFEVLAQLHPKDWAEIRRAMKGGTSPEDILARMREEKRVDKRVDETWDTPEQAQAAKEGHEATLKALGIADQHEVIVKPVELPRNSKGRRHPCYGIYIRDL
jgi:hypothetical protein